MYIDCRRSPEQNDEHLHTCLWFKGEEIELKSKDGNLNRERMEKDITVNLRILSFKLAYLFTRIKDSAASTRSSPFYCLVQKTLPWIIYISCKYLRTKRIAMEPSPTAEEIPVVAPNLTSPEAKIPGTLVSDIKGSLFNFQSE